MPASTISSSTSSLNSVLMLTPRDGAGLAIFPSAAGGRDALPRNESGLADFRAAGISSTADEDFDIMIEQMWNEHLSRLPPKIAETKKWRYGYWKNWYRDIVFDSDDPVLVEPDVSDPMWSIEGSPPVADDARRGRPAEQDQQRQGRPSVGETRVA